MSGALQADNLINTTSCVWATVICVDIKHSCCSYAHAQAQTCTDKLKNGAETDIDCGGSTCARCLAGAACLVNNDCSSLNCTGSRCQDPLQCSNGVSEGVSIYSKLWTFNCQIGMSPSSSRCRPYTRVAPKVNAMELIDAQAAFMKLFVVPSHT